MTDIQVYLDAFSFLLSSTEILSRFGIALAVSIVAGALFLDRFRLWFGIVMMIIFLALTQWQINFAMRDLGFTNAQIMPPHIIMIISGILFVAGSGIGYALKMKFTLPYTDESPEVVAEDIVHKINGGAMDHSPDPPITQKY
ncbi:hypothetical protein KA005_71120 [bacterium]|nr:hypothetical protein [bacterium]